MKNMKHSVVILIAVLATLSAMANHPWLTRVYEYRPAPGQFINTMPEYEEGDRTEPNLPGESLQTSHLVVCATSQRVVGAT